MANLLKTTPQGPQDSRDIPHDILMAEFEFLADAAQQANEDRARVTQYYFMTLGSVVASAFGLKEISAEYLRWAYVGLGLLFLMLTGFGHLTIRQLIGLRLAWLKYSLEMDVIKQYYIDHFPHVQLSSALRLLPAGLPNAYKSGSMANLLAAATCLMSSLALTVGLVALGLALVRLQKIPILIGLGLVAGIILYDRQYRYYREQLTGSRVQKEIDEIKKK